MLSEHLEIDPGAVVVPLQHGTRGEFQEIAVPDLVLGKQQQVIGLALPGGGRTLGEVGLYADDRMQACFREGLVPLHRGVHDTVIRDREVVDPQLLGTGDVLIGAAHAVQEGELGMQMQVGKLSHRANSSASRTVDRRGVRDLRDPRKHQCTRVYGQCNAA